MLVTQVEGARVDVRCDRQATRSRVLLRRP